MRFIGHRGASYGAPENTLGAFRRALSSGAGFECDLQLLKCGALVALHDDSLKRTATQTVHSRVLTEIQFQELSIRNAAEITSCELEHVEVGSLMSGAAWSAERVPTFQQILHMLQNHHTQSDAHCYAELKALNHHHDAPYDSQLPLRAAEMVRAAGIQPSQLTWISFNHKMIKEMKQLTPEFEALIVGDPQGPEEAWQLAFTAFDIGADGIDLRAIPSLVTPELVSWHHLLGKKVAVWVGAAPAKEDTFETWEAMRHAGVDAFTSNLPPELHLWASDRDEALIQPGEPCHIA